MALGGEIVSSSLPTAAEGPNCSASTVVSNSDSSIASSSNRSYQGGATVFGMGDMEDSCFSTRSRYHRFGLSERSGSTAPTDNDSLLYSDDDESGDDDDDDDLTMGDDTQSSLVSHHVLWDSSGHQRSEEEDDAIFF